MKAGIDKRIELKKRSLIRRRKRIRKNIRGTAERPRLSVFRSLKHIYAQLINDTTNKSLFTVSDLSPELGSKIKEKSTKSDLSALVGELVAKKALSRKIKKIIFDRGSYKYHGRIKSLAEAARNAGLEF